MDEQVGHLEEGGLLGELLDRVAAVLEDPLLAVDEGDRTATGGGVDEAGVVDREARVVLALRLDLSQIRGLDAAVGDRDVVLLSGAVVSDGERISHPTNLTPGAAACESESCGRVLVSRGSLVPSLRSSPRYARPLATLGFEPSLLNLLAHPSPRKL